MKIRAVICDVYHTLLEIGPPPADAGLRWKQLVRERLGTPPALTLDEFAEGCRRVIEREHASARDAGVMNPEVFWPDVTTEALPGLALLPDAKRDDFLYQHAQLQREVRLMPGAAEVLKESRRSGVLLGIASNSQPYTLRELDAALADAELNRAIFDPALCFWSFDCGFSKPNPHVFRLVGARLRARGVAAAETLMVGDRPDNDVAPARAQGWRTWRLLPDAPPGDLEAGDWRRLAAFLSPLLPGGGV